MTTQESIKSLPEADLSQIILWAQQEIKARTEKRKQETIAKIKELADTVGVTVKIAGERGRPARTRAGAKPAKAKR